MEAQTGVPCLAHKDSRVLMGYHDFQRITGDTLEAVILALVEHETNIRGKGSHIALSESSLHKTTGATEKTIRSKLDTLVNKGYLIRGHRVGKPHTKTHVLNIEVVQSALDALPRDPVTVGHAGSFLRERERERTSKPRQERSIRKPGTKVRPPLPERPTYLDDADRETLLTLYQYSEYQSNQVAHFFDRAGVAGCVRAVYRPSEWVDPETEDGADDSEEVEEPTAHLIPAPLIERLEAFEVLFGGLIQIARSAFACEEWRRKHSTAQQDAIMETLTKYVAEMSGETTVH